MPSNLPESSTKSKTKHQLAMTSFGYLHESIRNLQSLLNDITGAQSEIITPSTIELSTDTTLETFLSSIGSTINDDADQINQMVNILRDALL